MMWYGDNGSGWWNVGMVVMGVFWLALIAIAVWAVVRLTRKPPQGPANEVDSARHILDRRLAAGEIDSTQYAETRRVLEGRSVDVTHK